MGRLSAIELTDMCSDDHGEVCGGGPDVEAKTRGLESVEELQAAVERAAEEIREAEAARERVVKEGRDLEAELARLRARRQEIGFAYTRRTPSRSLKTRE